jgi:hypothetical protein
MAEPNIIPLLKPSIDGIINVALQFPTSDLRREQLWSLIVKDEDLTRQLLARLKEGNNATVSIPN